MTTEFSGVTVLLPVFADNPDQGFTQAMRRAVFSVLNQECAAPLELLIVDDGSAAPIARIPELADIFASENVTHLRLLRNEGIVFALNAGLQRARHDLIARIDADDCWRPGKLERQLAAFGADPDLTLVGSGMRCVHADSRLDTDHVRGPSWGDCLEFAVAEGCPFPHGSILARKDIFHLLGGYPHNPGFSCCEDFALWSVWLRFFKCAMLPGILFEYTISPGQVSSRNAERQLAASDAIRQSLRALSNHERIPDLLARIAERLKVPLLAAGKLLFTAWRLGEVISVEPALYRDVRELLPDRAVRVNSDPAGPVAGGVFDLAAQ